MRKLLALAFFLCFLVCFGCTNEPKGVKDLTGYIIFTSPTSENILVSEKESSSDIPLASSYYIFEDTVIEGTSGKKYSPEDFSLGMLVDAYHTGEVRESYPPQSDVTTILIHDDEASLETAKALSIALKTLDSMSQWLVVSVNHVTSDLYEIQLVELMGSEQPITLKVDLKTEQVIE
ncbi:DUF3221 domain-containing protein [Litchfieldia alkalitelluris]|uniref:DUF3221 domain-containing protein n=1 Tax=Litchfieldia alkalitelluris TaxID=304268 RepID=UPI000998120F|nr:DUF3221 domain-containing protein [Litchfieldia alkalitelluris]